MKPLNRRAFLKSAAVTTAALSLTSCSTVQNSVPGPKPNILWIVADDLGPDLGCYGTPQVHTPNIDRLAAEGTRYENFFTVTAVCSPSRSAFITGMYPCAIDCHQHRTKNKRPLPAPVQPVAEYFKQQGYFVINGSESTDKQGRYKHGKEDYNFKTENFYDGTDWSQRQPGQPFFAQVQIFYPHRPFRPDPDHPINPAKVTFPACYPDHPLTRKDWALYLETVQNADKKVGHVLKRLEDDGLLDSTVIFFFGDQGRPMVRAKQFLYDGGIRSALIVRQPNKRRAGTVSDDLISNIDLSATSMALAGVPIPGHLHGRDFLNPKAPKRTYIAAMRDRRDETVDRIRCIRTKDFKYIRNFYPDRPYTQFNCYKKTSYPVLTLMQVLNKQGKLTPEQARFMAPTRPAEELYDLRTDPDELNNLAANPKYASKLTDLRKTMDRWLAQYDKGTYPEAPAEIAFWKDAFAKRYPKILKNRGLATDATDEQILDWWLKKHGLTAQ